MSLRFMTRVPLVVVGSVIMALVVHVKLGLLLTVALPLLIFPLLDYEKSFLIISYGPAAFRRS